MFTINASLMRMVILSVGISADILDYFLANWYVSIVAW